MKKKSLVYIILSLISVLVLIVGCFVKNPYGITMKIIATTALFVLGILSWIVGKEKNNSKIKAITLIILYLGLLSWIIPASAANGSEIVDRGLMRMSLYDLFDYPYLALQYFMQQMVFILAVGGLYGVISENGKFRNKLEKMAKTMKNSGPLFIVLTSVILTLLSSVFGLNLMLFLFIPILCGIILLMGYDKITAFLVTFISPLIGIIGGTYGLPTAYINQIAGLTFDTEIIAKIALLVICYVIFISYVIRRTKKVKENKSETKDEVVPTAIELLGEKKQTKKPCWPIFTILGILFVLIILGCTNWENVFEVDIFTNLHKSITEFTINNETVFSYLIGELPALGNWTYIEITLLIFIATILIGVINRMKLNEFLSALGNGVKKLLKPALIVTFAYVIVMIVAWHPFIITATDWFINTVAANLLDLIHIDILADLVRLIFVGINSFISGILNIEMIYVASSTLPILTTAFESAKELVAVASQAIVGLSFLIAPTSSLLILGLEYLHIPYKEWLKSSWKLILLELLAIILVITLFVIIL